MPFSKGQKIFALLFIISFFRIPNRKLTHDANKVIAPADGKVVVIEEMFDEEYFKEKRLRKLKTDEKSSVLINLALQGNL